MESECRKDGYYFAQLFYPNGQYSIEVVQSKDGLLYNIPHRLLIPDKMVVQVFIDSRVNEVYFFDNFNYLEFL